MIYYHKHIDTRLKAETLTSVDDEASNQTAVADVNEINAEKAEPTEAAAEEKEAKVATTVMGDP